MKMRTRKVIAAFLAAICIFSLVGFCALGTSAEGTETVYATTSASVMQGSYGYAYVYLDDLTDLASLTVSVYYDADKISVTDIYNRVACELYDSSNKDGCVQFTYIFDGEGSNTKTNLFYFQYFVKDTAEPGNTYFDIVVSDAYNSAFEPMSYSGSRCSFTITEKTVSKTCHVYSDSSLSTSVGEEFEISYRLSTYQIASGSFTIQYDKELFEFVSLSHGNFLDGKITDVNSDLDGTVSVSFVGTEYSSNYQLLTVRFRTIKNVKQESDISLSFSELYDLDFNRILCNGYTTAVNVSFDETYVEDSPSMSVSATYSEDTGKVTAIIRLDKDSMLGAGDFVLSFNPEILMYESAQKGFSTTFFNINDKNVSNGILKFSIISMQNITDEQIVLIVEFDAVRSCDDVVTNLSVTGSGLTDSLINPIILKFEDTNITVPLKHTGKNAVIENKVDPNCTEYGSYDSVVYCSVCNSEVSREKKTIDKLGHDHSTEWTVDVKPTCTTVGSKSHHCSRCGDKADVTEVPANGHSYGEWHETLAPTCTEKGTEQRDCANCDHFETREVKANGHSYTPVVTAPTCTAQGYTTHTCHCGDSYVDSYTEKIAHSFGEWHETKAPTCTEKGTEQRDCNNCDHFETREVKANGHSYTSVVTAPTCTVQGYTTHTCHCGDSYVDSYTEKTAHSYGEWHEILAPTCTEKGTEQRDCANCDHFETREVKANGHSYASTVVPPTTSEGGYTIHTCDVCGDSYKDTFTDPLPYTLGDVMGDGEVNSDDAIYLLKHTLFPDMYPINQASDFDGSGELNSDDAIYLLKHTLFPDMYPLNDAAAVVFALPPRFEISSSSKSEDDDTTN